MAGKFVDRVRTTTFASEVATRYQKRFKKFGDRLFTFLDFDGVAWNNNAAEHAAKSFAKYRRTSDGLFTEGSLKRALVMLSILETCRYNDVNFLRFLLGGREELAELLG